MSAPAARPAPAGNDITVPAQVVDSSADLLSAPVVAPWKASTEAGGQDHATIGQAAAAKIEAANNAISSALTAGDESAEPVAANADAPISAVAPMVVAAALEPLKPLSLPASPIIDLIAPFKPTVPVNPVDIVTVAAAGAPKLDIAPTLEHHKRANVLKASLDALSADISGVSKEVSATHKDVADVRKQLDEVTSTVSSLRGSAKGPATASNDAAAAAVEKLLDATNKRLDKDEAAEAALFEVRHCSANLHTVYMTRISCVMGLAGCQ
jgi:hypothetical protein